MNYAFVPIPIARKTCQTRSPTQPPWWPDPMRMPKCHIFMNVDFKITGSGCACLSAFCPVRFWPDQRIMGSLGWCQCYWCDEWVYNPYIIDWIGEILCRTCIDHHLDGDGSPQHPNAVDHRAGALMVVLPPLAACGIEAALHVASFLESPWRPGAGSRQTPRPR